MNLLRCWWAMLWGGAGQGGVSRLTRARGLGQIAQLVEQGTENPRVGGSTPSLAILTGLLLSGCGPPCNIAAVWTSRCDRLCCEVADSVEPCIDDVFTWSDLGSSDRQDFVRQCFDQWSEARADLTSYELQQATLVCRDVRREISRIPADAPDRCEEIRSLYAERP